MLVTETFKKKNQVFSLLLGFLAATTSLTAFVRFLVSAISAFFLPASFFSLTSSAGLSSDEDSTSEVEDAFFALVVAAFFFSGVATLDTNIQIILSTRILNI